LSDVLILRTPLLVDGSGASAGDLALAIGTRSGKAVVISRGDFSLLRATYPEAGLRVASAVATQFANAHTHLDLSTHPTVEGEFELFVGALAAHRRAHPQARGLAAAAIGMRQVLGQKSAAVGDIVAREPVMRAELTQSPLAGVAYWEVVCTHQSDVPAALQSLLPVVQAWRRLQRPGGPVVGLSPHSPYLVCRDMLQALARLSIDEGVPLQIHVAESPAEIEFFRSGEGPLAEVLARLGWRKPPTAVGLGIPADPSLTPIRYLADIGFLDAAPTLVHCVNVTDEDVHIIAEHRCPVITCPRSNQNLRCGVFPWEKFVNAGVSVALATDSVASACDLDLRSELQACLDLHGPRLGLPRVLEWLTAGAFRAMRLPTLTIGPGYPADALMLLG
jgi:cytosine/adenosine deaminase-related metal-dependent hydrolase